MTALRIFLGYEPREHAAYEVARKTAEAFGCVVTPLNDSVLRAAGILTRPMDTRGGLFDIISGRPQSTRFAISRFAAPILAHAGWALCADCDVVFLRDPHELRQFADESKAVYVVKHKPLPANGTKMDGQAQVPYPRKNWSSVAYWNASHPANKRLNLTTLNSWHRDDLHAFGWLHDDEIGELPAEWNHLVGISPRAGSPCILHFTNGTPDMPGYENCEYADEWRKHASNR